MLYPVYVKSRIRYIRFALNPVWVVSFYPVYVISSIRYIRFALNRVCARKIQRGPFCNIENSPRNVISGIRHIRFALNPVWVVFLSKRTPHYLLQLCKIIHETLYVTSRVYVISGIRYVRFPLNPVWVVLLSKRTPWHFYRFEKKFPRNVIAGIRYSL